MQRPRELDPDTVSSACWDWAALQEWLEKIASIADRRSLDPGQEARIFDPLFGSTGSHRPTKFQRHTNNRLSPDYDLTYTDLHLQNLTALRDP